ncbi:uncharacterized protein LOC129000334 [Macrosteles quadrilineatus]|uniref:uncharacterized protein LOC129000334 n=1 Tax=Macrosteles quadrilineatus TaxID=74068 RepID=UPI0023E20212|nr:uncharacterized protein LOC129000334 [Macrosteles quadrilineatus]
MLTRRENLLIRPWQERRYIHHRHKVETALPAIDVRPPAQRHHVTCKLKKLQKEAERCERIHHDNFTLLQHLSGIMKTNRLDNYWVEAPPNFLHRVGIYHVKDHKEQQRQDLEEAIRSLQTRKEKCLGCNPSHLPAQIHIPEDRVPWEAPKKRLSRRSSSFMEDLDSTHTKASTKKSSSESLAKLNTTPKSSPSTTELSRPSTGQTTSQRFPMVETHSVVLKHGALRLVVNFPPQTTVKLRTGQTERLLQSEFCQCSRPQDKTTPTPVSE